MKQKPVNNISNYFGKCDIENDDLRVTLTSRCQLVTFKQMIEKNAKNNRRVECFTTTRQDGSSSRVSTENYL